MTTSLWDRLDQNGGAPRWKNHSQARRDLVRTRLPADADALDALAARIAAADGGVPRVRALPLWQAQAVESMDRLWESLAALTQWEATSPGASEIRGGMLPEELRAEIWPELAEHLNRVIVWIQEAVVKGAGWGVSPALAEGASAERVAEVVRTVKGFAADLRVMACAEPHPLDAVDQIVGSAEARAYLEHAHGVEIGSRQALDHHRRAGHVVAEMHAGGWGFRLSALDALAQTGLLRGKRAEQVKGKKRQTAAKMDK
jgi:hypothetical protein